MRRARAIEASAALPVPSTFQCSDGWLAVAANTQAQFRGLCDLLGLPGVADDPALVSPVGQGGATNVAAVDRPRLVRLMEEAFARNEAAELEPRLNAAGVPAARVRSVAEFLREARAGEHVGLKLDRIDYGATGTLHLGPGVAGLGEGGPDASAAAGGRHGRDPAKGRASARRRSPRWRATAPSGSMASSRTSDKERIHGER